MVSGSRIEGEGGAQILSVGVRETIQSIKEIVGNHSDADIYVTLKETNMDPNETAQKLLNQDPFHEVQRKRDKKKEGTSFKFSVPVEPRKPSEHVVQGMKSNAYSDRNLRRGGYGRNNVPGVTREFRVVRDNRISQNVNREIKPPVHSSVTVSNVSSDSHSKQAKDAGSSGSDRNDISGGTRPLVLNVAPPVVTSPNGSVVGVYSSSSDPVHVPSLAPRPAAKVGAIKREVGVVGVRRHASESSAKQSLPEGSFVPNSQLGRHGSSREPFKSDQLIRFSVPESSVPSRTNHQSMARYKAPQANKEWKPKSSPKPIAIGPGVIGTPTKSAPSPANNSKNLETEAAQLQDKSSHANIHDNQNVIIAAHIRVSETDRCRLTFGSLGTESESSQNPRFQELRHVEPSSSLSVSAPESSSDGHSGSKQVEPVDELVQSSGSVSPASGAGSEQQSTNRRESPSPQNMDSFTDIGLVRHSCPSHTPSEPHQQQDPPELPSFSVYDSEYFTPAVDESLRSRVLPISQEAFSLHVTNSIPGTTIPVAPVAQIYPQVHLSHFANLSPFRQFLSPVYVPPMAIPGYSNNPTYSPHHPSTANGYLLLPGANSPHLTANGLKYGIQQYKSVPTGSPTGFGDFTSPTGFAINAPGVVGSASGLDDSSRLKYKDGNLYVPNPQAEMSAHWMNPRDIPSLQSASYYNVSGQMPHAAYVASHTGHASFNAAAQSSHMQFPALYHHPPPPSALGHMHHMGGNVGVGLAAAAPGAQIGGYQQLNWTGNF